MYKINKLHGYSVQHREYSQYFIITINRYCESLYGTSVTYIILHINYTLIFKKRKLKLKKKNYFKKTSRDTEI